MINVLLDSEFLEIMPNWYYDKKQLRLTPSSTDGISYEIEGKYRREGARFIIDIGNKLGLSSDTIATGVVYFHRFYMFHSFKDFPRYVTACCCLFLAGKVEETPKKCRDIIKTARPMLTDVQFAQFGDDPREEVMTLERILLQTIKFDFHVNHPYTYLIRYAKSLKGNQQNVQNMVQKTWTFINDSLCTTLCLQWEPEIVAIALMYLACKLSRFDVTDWSGRLPSHTKWWDIFVENISIELLEDICHQLLDLYSAPASNSEQQSPSSLPPSKMPTRPSPHKLVPTVRSQSRSGVVKQGAKVQTVRSRPASSPSANLAASPAKKVRTTPPSDVVGISDKNPLPGSPNIVKPPEPNNNLPGLPSAPPPGFNFTYSPYQQQTAVGYQAPYVSAPVGATAGNQYPPPNFQYPGYSQTGQYHPNPNQQYQQADGIYPPPPSLNAATANQVPIRQPPPPMNASVIANVPHNLEFPQLPAPDLGLQQPNSYQQTIPTINHPPPRESLIPPQHNQPKPAPLHDKNGYPNPVYPSQSHAPNYPPPNFSHRPPLYPPHQINYDYNKPPNPMPQQPSSESLTPPGGFHRPPRHPRVAMHHRMNRPPYQGNRNY